jgi:hypothetical protein
VELYIYSPHTSSWHGLPKSLFLLYFVNLEITSNFLFCGLSFLLFSSLISMSVFLHFFDLFISSLYFHFLSDPRMASSALVTDLLWRKTTKCCMSDTKFTLGRYPWSNNAAASLGRRVTENHSLDIPETWAQECHKSASNMSFLAAFTNAECKQYISVLPLIYLKKV